MLRLLQIAVALFMASQVAELATTYISPALEQLNAALSSENQ